MAVLIIAKQEEGCAGIRQHMRKSYNTVNLVGLWEGPVRAGSTREQEVLK